MGSLRDLFTNLTPGQNALIKRWKRGVYRTSQRGAEPPIRDLRGPVVATIATVQPFSPRRRSTRSSMTTSAARPPPTSPSNTRCTAPPSRVTSPTRVSCVALLGSTDGKLPKLFDCTDGANRFEGSPEQSEPAGIRYARRWSATGRFRSSRAAASPAQLSGLQLTGLPSPRVRVS